MPGRNNLLFFLAIPRTNKKRLEILFINRAYATKQTLTSEKRSSNRFRDQYPSVHGDVQADLCLRPYPAHVPRDGTDESDIPSESRWYCQTSPRHPSIHDDSNPVKPPYSNPSFLGTFDRTLLQLFNRTPDFFSNNLRTVRYSREVSTNRTCFRTPLSAAPNIPFPFSQRRNPYACLNCPPE